MRPRWPEGVATPRWAQSNDSLASHNSLWRAAVYFLVCVAVYECLVLSYPAPASGRANNPFYNRLKAQGVNIGGYQDTEAATQPIASGRVLVTGGGGNVGKHLVRRLLVSNTPATILDTIFYPEELSSLSTDSRSLLKVHIGDIRNSTAVASALTPDIVGVVHLAAVSRVSWCLQNEKDCMDVNERGTKLVLEMLSKLNEHDNGRRWFILASSREVYGDAAIGSAAFLEDAEKKPANTYGRSKLAAERVVERYIADWSSEDGPPFGGMHTVALRLSNVYGGIYDHLERLVPSITTQALSHQVIQIAGGQQDFDMLHIDDCVEAFVLAITYLTEKARNTWSIPYFGSTPFSFEAVNVASGFSAKVTMLVDAITSLTRSQSPIRYLSADNRYPNVYRGSVDKAKKLLGFRARIGIQEGLLAFVKAHVQHASASLSRQIESTCPSAVSGQRLSVDLSKLDGCRAHVEMNLQGEFVGLAPPHSQNNGLGYWTIKPLDAPEDPIRTVIVSASASVSPNTRTHDRRSDLKTLVRLHGWWEETRNDAESSFLGMWRNDDTVSISESFAVDQIFDKNLTQSLDGQHPIVDWELQRNPDATEGTLRLVVPGTNPPLQLITPPFAGANFSLGIVDDEAENSWNVRLTPTCCPAPAPWPYSAEDPIEWSIQYQRTSLSRPFLASPLKTLCDRLTRAQRKFESDLVALSLVVGANRTHPPSRKLSELPTRWAHADLAACSNLCDDGFPTICVDTGDCQCVLSSCVPRKRFPFPDHAFKNETSFPPTISSPRLSLTQRVARLSWMSTLRPRVASYLSTHPHFPKIHVTPLTPFDVTWLDTVKAPDGEKLDPDKLLKHHCLSADGQLRKALLRLGNVPEKEAEMMFIMHYQGRTDSDGIIDKAYDWILRNTPGFDASKVIIPFTFDFGPCLTFDWNAWRIREKMGLRIPPAVKFTTAWSVMGDLNSPCYRPHRDVVIPPRTCLSPELFSSFATVSSVEPARNRDVIVAFAGSRWGTGFIDRQRLECVRAGWHDEDRTTSPRRLRGLEEGAGPVLRSVWGGSGPYRDYTDLLGHTIFCPVAAGTAGWSPRVVEAIYAGCIPVLIGHATIPPFFDIFDWSKFSVRIEPSEISHLEDILIARYSIDDIETMQTNLILVRDAFVYPLDEMGDDEAQDVVLGGEDEARRGPLFWALHATRMRILTKWPVDEGFDRP